MAKFTKVKKSFDRSREARKPCIAAKVEYGWKTQAHNLHFIVAKCMLNVCRKVSLTLLYMLPSSAGQMQTERPLDKLHHIFRQLVTARGLRC